MNTLSSNHTSFSSWVESNFGHQKIPWTEAEDQIVREAIEQVISLHSTLENFISRAVIRV